MLMLTTLMHGYNRNTAEFLAQASTLLSSSLDYKTILRGIAELAVPHVADICAIDLVSENGSPQRLAVAAEDQSKAELFRMMIDVGAFDADMPIGPARVMRTRQPVLVTNISDEHFKQASRNQQHLEALRNLGLRSGICVPLTARNKTLGAISFGVIHSQLRYSDEHLCFAEDLARRVALAIDNAMLHAQAQEAIRMREDLLAIVSHDLKNPLTAIFMSTALQKRFLGSGPNTDLIKGQIENIQKAAESMNRMISDLLDFARIGSGHLKIERRPCYVATILERTRELFGALASEKSIRLHTMLASPELKVECDHDRIIQVLSNLVGNSLKLTPAGGTISVCAEGTSESNVQFLVKDTGPGIGSAQLPHIFDRYWQGTIGGRQNAGLGLSIAKGIIEAHGGRIWVESKLGEGSTFYFTLKKLRDDKIAEVMLQH